MAATSLNHVTLPRSVGSAAIAVQLAWFVALILLMQIDWRARLNRGMRA